MQVINVIEIFQAIPEVPYSWIVKEDENPDITIKKAQDFFIAKCREHDIDPEDEEGALDDGYYENGHYEVRLNWSIVQNAS